jgi:hypothetical protein
MAQRSLEQILGQPQRDGLPEQTGDAYQANVECLGLNSGIKQKEWRPESSIDAC